MLIPTNPVPATQFPGSSKLLELFTPNTFSKVFYEILFPPVIFNAGFTLKQRNFMRNIGSIATYAIIGTFVSTVVMSMSIYGINKAAHFAPLDFIECIMFGALLSATDTVSTIAVLIVRDIPSHHLTKQWTYTRTDQDRRFLTHPPLPFSNQELNVVPLLYSLVFGESVLNDAVAIALCSALEPYVGHAPQWSTIGHVARDFVVIVVGSVGVGLGVGLLSAFVAAREQRLNLSTTYQMMQILVLAYFSYVLAEYWKISGVISLFVCALAQSHYCWHSISEQSRRALFQVSGGLDYLSELLVFLSFGILLFSPENLVRASWNPLFILIVLVLLFVSRALNVFVLSFFLNLGRKSKIPFKIQLVLWWCGMRGIVTLLLVLNFHTPNRSMLINATFVVVFFTNIVIGILTRPIVLALNVKSTETAANLQDPGHTLPPEFITRAQLNERSVLARWWFLLDNKFLKRAFGGRARIVVEDDSDGNGAGAASGACETTGLMAADAGHQEAEEREDEEEGGKAETSTRTASYVEFDVAGPGAAAAGAGAADEEDSGDSVPEVGGAEPIATAGERALAMMEETEVKEEEAANHIKVRSYGSTSINAQRTTSDQH